MPRSDLLQLPVHSRAPLVIYLHAVHAEIARAGVGILRDNAGQRNETAAVQRPALLDRQVEQSRGGRGCNFVTL